MTSDNRFIVSIITPEGIIIGPFACMSHVGASVTIRPVPGSHSSSCLGFTPSDEVMRSMKLFLGVHESQLIFLDHDCWLCTWDINAAAHQANNEPESKDFGVSFPGNDIQRHDRLFTVQMQAQRHFFIPMEWMNSGTSHLAKVNSHGTFFCPKQGEVAIVRNGVAC